MLCLRTKLAARRFALTSEELKSECRECLRTMIKKYHIYSPISTAEAEQFLWQIKLELVKSLQDRGFPAAYSRTFLPKWFLLVL